MTMANSKGIGRRGLIAATAAAVTTALLAPAASAAPAADNRQNTVVRALERAAHPLRSTEPGGRTDDLRALGAMIGDAKVVGLGEATHGSHEFFAMKERVFRYLVQEKGFTTFALEMSWSAGLRIDAYLQGGEGDPRRIVEETMAHSPWERQEFVSLIGWMREYNRHHPEHPVHFMGDDVGAPGLGDEVFARVVSYVRKADPRALPRLDALYEGLRPLDDTIAYLGKPVAERRQNATRAQQALDLVTAARGDGGEEYEWAVQHARVIAQTFAFATFDLDDAASVNAAELLRDQAMADNTAWWQRRTGHRILLSAHNGHVGYLASDPEMYARTQGAVLRDAFGRDYLSIGFTFDRGSFLTMAASLGDAWDKVTVPPATPDMSEYTLDRVRHQDYYADLRTAPPAARAWLDGVRPLYEAGSVFTKDPLPTLALGKAYDVLVHLHQVREAGKL
ncbi:erythromycin esterase [Kitasatospora sp. MAA19]|uniref:erythromycin esterase family protein n=1 Tax=unclassified Kitasatospora TaxID=2633591 RepID=UPI002476B776|nr:erythromycin esterase family protein [Kitasatospora sp. MAA19]MDH6708490.1 erythromycin esterase [Kitasatospora sp. MAA19]